MKKEDSVVPDCSRKWTKMRRRKVQEEKAMLVNGKIFEILKNSSVESVFVV